MQHTSVSVLRDNEVSALRHNQTDVDIGLGQIRETSVRVYVASNYAARYNHAVKNYKYVDQGMNDRIMRNMRGGHFFLYNFIVLVLFCGSIYSITNMQNNTPIVAMPITTSIIYLLLTFYNLYVYRTNDNVMHDCMIEVHDSYLAGWANRFFQIPVHARIQNRELIAASDGTTTAILAQLQQRYHHLTDIRIMIHNHQYKTTYGTFPIAIIVHFLLFLGILAGSIYQLLMNLNLI